VEATAIFIVPEYSGQPWAKLDRLKAGTDKLAELFARHGFGVSHGSTGTVAQIGEALTAQEASEEPLLVYVGGHGRVHARSYYVAVDSTPAVGKLDGFRGLAAGNIASAVAAHDRDVLVVLDTCYAGEGVVEVIWEAVRALADDSDEIAFGVVACCRAYEPAHDGVFIERVLQLINEGPGDDDLHAWGPGDARIPTAALFNKLGTIDPKPRSWGNFQAADLRLFPNPRWNAREPEGRVDVKARLRSLGPDAAEHLIEKSTGFIGRESARRRVAEWLASGSPGVFVVTGGPGTGKSALIGLRRRGRSRRSSMHARRRWTRFAMNCRSRQAIHGRSCWSRRSMRP
jgi:hypothetical protein